MGILSEFIRWLPGYFFPKICYGCEKEGTYVCEECRKAVERVLDEPRCPECGKEATFGAAHPGCRRRWGLDGLVSYYKYAGWAKEIVKEAKFGKHHRYAAMKELAKEMALSLLEGSGTIFSGDAHRDEPRRHFFNTLGSESSLNSSSPPDKNKDKVLFGSSSMISKMPSSAHQKMWKNWIIVPVPLHWWREFKRGFNQAELIAGELAAIWKIPMIKMLIRRQYTEPQTLTEKEVALTEDQEKKLKEKYKSSLQLDDARKKLLNKLKAKRRKKNIEGAFEMRLPRPACGGARNDVLGTNVLLVDDVWTTGATMKECCRVLKLAGVKRVWGVTLLRA